MIMESHIDPIEWKNEIDRVEKLLEISEYPEFLESHSHSSIAGNNNRSGINNNCDNIFAIAENPILKFNSLSVFFDKTANDAKFINQIKVSNEVIEDELRKISNFEKTVSSSNLIKNKVRIIYI
jgi:hypothetical protein